MALSAKAASQSSMQQPVAADVEAKRRRKSATPTSTGSSMLELFTALASWSVQSARAVEGVKRVTDVV